MAASTVALSGLVVLLPGTAVAADGVEDADYNYVGPSPAREYVFLVEDGPQVAYDHRGALGHVYRSVHPQQDRLERDAEHRSEWRSLHARVLRNCKPGSSVETNGCGYRHEADTAGDLAKWNSRVVNRVREVVSYMIDDDNLEPKVDVYPAEWSYREAGDDNIYSGQGLAPSTQDNVWAWVKTRYQNGTAEASDDRNRPFNCPYIPVNCE